ncbi:proteinase inhibitor I4 serpin [Streptomyces venezuelae]|uniref:Proteinase inhibitor I4 serpin n=1 Tax=Streptomyces venezuelae TaxID=54571 RepID=A0A5P2CWM1_STRVZ|nr:serpin family protein [Streptomyces venezuelae]QES46833.1 proteinase inhibitor I4 serpin [Streptomyces venezuelae]
MRTTTTRAVNRLTARWAREAAEAGGGTVVTAAGVWPLLALLADGAAGPARTELAEALGIPAEAAAEAARELLAGLAGVRGLETATGLWARRDLPLEEPWTAGLPPGTRGELTGEPDTDRAVLDHWAAEHTGGLIDRMPVPVFPDTLLVLASALALQLTWLQPFTERPRPITAGPWAGRTVRGLGRWTSLLDRVRVADTTAGPLTLLEVVGDGGVDVHLVLGEPAAGPGEVLAEGIAAVTGGGGGAGARPVAGSALPEGTPGPGLDIRRELSYSPEPRLAVQTVAFSVEAQHDLLAQARLFGLETASDDRFGHFPGISGKPMAIGAAAQSALARFHAEGFEAAAVTAVAMAPGGAAPPRPRYRTRRIGLVIDRPFGFLAVHRTSKLVLAAGWVADPLPGSW